MNKGQKLYTSVNVTLTLRVTQYIFSITVTLNCYKFLKLILFSFCIYNCLMLISILRNLYLEEAKIHTVGLIFLNIKS